MMTPKVVDHDRLSAFADGELTPEEAAEVVMHLADHPEDQAFVDEVMAANEALVRAFAGPMSQPVPKPIHAAIFGLTDGAAESKDAAERVQEASTARILPFRRRVWAGLALAACVAGLGLALPQSPFHQGPGAPVFEPGPLAAGSALHRAISGQASGQTLALDGADLTILASLPVEGGHCREAELIDRAKATLTMALICDEGAGWQVQVALSEPLPEAATGFVPAGGVETGALDLWLDRMGAGLALGPEEEARAIAGGWAPP